MRVELHKRDYVIENLNLVHSIVESRELRSANRFNSMEDLGIWDRSVQDCKSTVPIIGSRSGKQLAYSKSPSVPNRVQFQVVPGRERPVRYIDSNIYRVDFRANSGSVPTGCQL